MVDSIRIALCQINPLVGDFAGNSAKIIDAARTATDGGAELALFPELVLCGFPPQDLLLRRDFTDAAFEALHHLARRLTNSCTAVVGLPYRVDRSLVDGPAGVGEAGLYDAVAVIRDGRIDAVVTKSRLSNVGPLDEFRYFTQGVRHVDTGGSKANGGTSHHASFVPLGGVDAAVVVGDELCSASLVDQLRRAGTRLVLNPIAAPFHVGSRTDREQRCATAAMRSGCPVVVVNGVGGQDELVFDGGSFVVLPNGEITHGSARFEEAVELVDVPLSLHTEEDAPTGSPVGARSSGEAAALAGEPRGIPSRPGPTDCAELWSALVLGLGDYITKNGFDGVGLGLSGGVDSALVAALAVDAIGSDRVHGVLMPSRYSSEGSVTDAEALADNLGIDTRIIPIEPAHLAFESMLSESFAGLDADLTEENLQARIRGMILMALSNKFGWLILVTGNKSESYVGYSTLYGDSAGGLAPIQDVDKQTVYQLCRWYNERRVSRGQGTGIPEAILTKAPSAELRPGQQDDQSLPDYSVLDPLLHAYVEEGMSSDDLIAAGYQAGLVDRVRLLVDRSEYKRRQSPPGLLVTKRSPGFRRLMPMTQSSIGPVTR